MRHLAATFGAVLLIASCSDDPAGPPPDGPECDVSTDCNAGWVCENGGCLQLCVSQSSCPSDRICDMGKCVTPMGGTVPLITGISGNDPGNQNRIIDGLVVDGRFLAQASFALDDGMTSTPLTVRTQIDDRAEVVLPIDVRSGDHTLVVTNSAGSAQQMITLQLPDLDGDTLLSRINMASGTVAFARLPAGTGPNQIAVGDHLHGNYSDTMHNHDADYVSLMNYVPPEYGSNLLPNGDFTKGVDGLDGWIVLYQGSGTTGSVVPVPLADLGAAAAAAYETGVDTLSELRSDIIPLDPSATYELVASFRNPAGGGMGVSTYGINLFTENGANEILGPYDNFYHMGDTNGSPPDEWLGVPEQDWKRFRTVFGAGIPGGFPPTARFMQVIVRLNADAPLRLTNGDRIHQVQAVGLYRYPFDNGYGYTQRVDNGGGTTVRVVNTAGDGGYMSGPWIGSDSGLLSIGTQYGSMAAEADVTFGGRSLIQHLVAGNVADAGMNEPYHRFNADSFHTTGLGHGQMYLEGRFIDSNSTISIGSGSAANLGVAQDVRAGQDLIVARDLRVLGAARLGGLHIFRKNGNNGSVSCDDYCTNTGGMWGDPGSCIGSLSLETGPANTAFTCAEVPGLVDDRSGGMNLHSVECACVNLL